MDQMSTQARALAAAAYGAGEMDFPIEASAAELAAAYVGEPGPLLAAGKAVAAAVYAEANEQVHAEELIDEWEALSLSYENYLPDDGEPAPDLKRQPWANYSREQVLTAAYLLVTRHAEDEQTPQEVGWDAQELLGSLAGHLKRELGGLGNVSPLDLADELAGTA